MDATSYPLYVFSREQLTRSFNNGAHMYKSFSFKAATVTAVLSIAAGPAFAAQLSGKSVTKGGTKAFCKGSTPITASLDEKSISITTPMASGGTATAKGKIDKSGAFKVSGGRITFTGKVKGKGASGSWEGPSCFGSFSLR